MNIMDKHPKLVLGIAIILLIVVFIAFCYLSAYSFRVSY